jgi:broad specificity phosphatase PhoE
MSPNLKTFWIIRHAESAGNAGLPTPSAGGIPLTERGHAQAECLADHITTPPDLFVVSPYLRTSQTAKPTLEKYSHIPVETWAIEEYTYLPAEVYANTTTAQRNQPAFDYFRKADPDLVLGEGAESFNQLIARVDTALERIIQSNHATVHLFSHGWYMRTLLWRLIFFPDFATNLNLEEFKYILPKSGWGYQLFSRFFAEVGRNPIRHFLIFSSIFSIPNGAILKFVYDPDQYGIQLVELTASHIPPNLRGTHLGNR